MFTHRIDVAARASTAALVGLCAFGIAGIVAPAGAGAAPPAITALPRPTAPPTGGDPQWESLAQNCHDGSMRACDKLADQTKYANAPIYNDYGFSCGGRVTYNRGGTYVTCFDQFPANP